MLCVMLATVVGTAQASHIHGRWLPDQAVHFSQASDGSQGDGEERCPMCAAMHSAMPATMQVVPVPVSGAVQRFSATALAGPQKQWIFAMFSRPPPALARTHAAG